MNHWGQPIMDLMATSENRVVPQFISPVPHPQAAGVDTFEVDWPASGLLYAFPPASIMLKFLQLVRNRRPKQLILLASMSPMRAYHADLLAMTRFEPLPVARVPGSLWQRLPREDSPRFHRNPELFTLGAWLLEFR